MVNTLSEDTSELSESDENGCHEPDMSMTAVRPGRPGECLLITHKMMVDVWQAAVTLVHIDQENTIEKNAK